MASTSTYAHAHAHEPKKKKVSVARIDSTRKSVLFLLSLRMLGPRRAQGLELDHTAAFTEISMGVSPQWKHLCKSKASK